MKSIKACVVLAAVAVVALPAFAATDVYGNEIVTYTEGGVQKTYQFWVSGTEAEIATKNDSDKSSSSSSALVTGTYSTPSAEPISLEARFRTWLKSLGTSLRSDKLGGFLMIVR